MNVIYFIMLIISICLHIISIIGRTVPVLVMLLMIFAAIFLLGNYVTRNGFRLSVVRKFSVGSLFVWLTFSYGIINICLFGNGGGAPEYIFGYANITSLRCLSGLYIFIYTLILFNVPPARNVK